jgi:PAS domain S-box-containing protein
MISETVDAVDLADLASDAAFAVDGGLEIVVWNEAAQQLLGYAPGDVIGQHCADVLQAVLPGGEPLCVPSCEGLRCFRRHRPFATSSCTARHKDGSWVPMSFASVVMPKRARRSGPGSIVAIVLLREDEEKRNRPSPETTLRVSTFGHFALATGGNALAIEKWQRKQALALMKYLVAHVGRAVHREALIEYLWPDVEESHGWERLKVTVYFLRQQLRAAGVDEDVVVTAERAYLIKREAVWVDAEIFESLVAEGYAHQRQQRWAEALRCYEEAQRLYRGDYMEEDIYDDTFALQRERLREICLDMLTGMAECHAACGHYAEAVRVDRDALLHDPCRESIHRALMSHLVSLGNPDAAVAQYHQCERVLARELEVAPMSETRHLYQRILEEDPGAAVARTAGRPPE